MAAINFVFAALRMDAGAAQPDGCSPVACLSPKQVIPTGGGHWVEFSLEPWTPLQSSMLNNVMLKANLELPALSAMPDEALLQKIYQRDQPALNELYGRYGHTLRAVIDSVVHEGAEAEDVLQELFL